MPAPEQALSHSKIGSANPGSSYNKLLAIFNKTNSTNSAARSNSINISFKERESYETALLGIDPSGYNRLAGCDLGDIFAPYVSASGSPVGSGQMPSFATGLIDDTNFPIRLQTLLPYDWEPQESGYIYVRSATPSGDSLANLVSGDKYYGPTNDVRVSSDIRSIGWRLPAVGVGWGYDTDGSCFPSGSNSSVFKGDGQHGWQVNPADYVAAPIDFRYDRTRNVWTTADNKIYAKITGNAQDGSNKRWIYTFRQVEKTTAGYGGWSLKSSGASGYLFNFVEDINLVVGTYGNGVDQANFEGSMDIKAIPNNVIVTAQPITRTNGQIEYWTSYENGVDGSCT